MHLDWRAFVIAFGAFLVLSIPLYVPWNIALPHALAVAITWLPYLGAFVAGVTFLHIAKFNRDRDCVLLGVVIGMTVGLVNFIGPAIGIHSDLPGLKYSLIIAGGAIPIAVVLVLAGAGSRNFFNAPSKRT